MPFLGESRNPSIASNIFVDTRSIKIGKNPPQAVEGSNKFNMHSVTVLCRQALDLTQWSTAEMLWIICKCRSSKKKMKMINFPTLLKHFISLCDKMISVCHVLPCDFQNKIKISPLLKWMQLLLTMAINWNTFNTFQSILRMIFESYTGQLC